MPLSRIRATRLRLRTKNLSLLLLGLAVFAVAGLANSPRITPVRGSTASAAAPGSPAPARAPAARRQDGSSHKQVAIDREHALQAANAADAARAQALRAEWNRLAAKLDGKALGRKRRAKIAARYNAIAAELDKVDPQLVTARPRTVDETEPNGDAREATSLDAQSDRVVVAAGSISRPGDVDVYAFEAPAGARVWAYLDASASSSTAAASRDSVLRLLDRDGVAVLGEGDDGASGSNFGRKVGTVLASAVAGATVPQTGRFFFEVRAFDPAATMESYNLVFVVSTAEPRPETPGNETSASATPLVAAGATAGVAAGALERAGDVDVYSVQAASGRPIFVALDADPERTGVATDATIELRDRDATTVLLRTAASGGMAPANAFSVMPPATGTYYLRVTGASVGKYAVLAAVGGAPLGITEIPIGPFCGDTGDSALEQNGSLQQDGIAATCDTMKTCPGASGPNVPYVAFPFVNDTGSDVCVTVNATSPCTGNSRAVVAAYLGSFDPNNICTNYLGDPGGNIGSGTTVTFSVTIPVGETFVITVNAARPGNDCGEFCFTLDSVVCTVECPDDIVVTTGPDSTQCGANVEFSAMSPCSMDEATCTDQNGAPVASGDLFPVGTTTVTCMLGGSSCSFMVTVTDDTPPAVTCPAPTTAAADGNCQAAVPNVLPNVTATDNCTAGDEVMLSQDPPAGTIVGVGTTTITVTATDEAGNASTCTTTFTVQDSVPPTVTCPDDIVVNATSGETCATTVNYMTPTGSDNCGTPTVVCVPASGSSFPVGMTTVTCTATDASGNTGTCTFTVTVNDTTPPSITCPANVTASAPAGSCAATVNYMTPTGSDNCGATTVMCVPASGSSFPVGMTTVTCTATDGSGNTASCSFTVTVNDVTPPSITCPANVVVQPPVGECMPVVEYAAPMVSDACTGMVSVVCTPASGSAFPLGTTTVTCTATDASGNTASCSFTVTVAGPPFTITCPANITATANAPLPGTCGLGAVVNYPAPTITSSACNGTVTVVCTPASGSVFPPGTTTVTCVATDQLGLSVSCSFTVTVSGGFGVCYIDDFSGDTFKQVVDPNSPAFGYWEYRVVATGEILCGIAEFVSYIPGRSHNTHDNDAETVWMDTNANLGSGSAVVQVTRYAPHHQFIIRDRNIFNNPPCQ